MDGDKSSDVLYVSNSGSNFISVINTRRNTVMENITVGESPGYIDKFSDAIYVALPDYNIISVIDPNTYTVKNITVGEFPLYILGHDSGIYVSNYNSNTVSVIDPNTNTVEKTIRVSDSPNYMFGNSASNAIYVIHENSDIMSVIDPSTETVKNITVREYNIGEESRYIHGGLYPDIYVANDDGVSVLNGMTNEVMAGITFDVNPFRGGDIICNTDGIGDSADSEAIDAPVNRYVYVSSGSKCTAEPSKGFEFNSWVEVRDDNSTRTINATSGSPWTAFLDALNLKPKDPPATLTINRFGNFTAYFRALPPAIPSEYLIPLYGIVVSTVVGFSIPSIINWRKSKKQTSRLNSYHREMTSLYDDGKLDESDTEHLNLIDKNIIDAYSGGKINNEQYSNLKKEISVIYEKINRKRIDKLMESSDSGLDLAIHVDKIKEDIENAYSEGKITELHYNLLNERIAKVTSNDDTPI